MADDGSVAPKERVNIVYKSDTGGMKEEIELPLRLMVVGDFIGKETGVPVEKRDVLNVDKDNFQEILKGQNVSIPLGDVKDVVGGKGGMLSGEIKIESLDDLEPDKIIDKVDPLKRLMEARQALIELKGPLDQQDSARERLQKMLSDLDNPEKVKSFLESIEMGTPEKKE